MSGGCFMGRLAHSGGSGNTPPPPFPCQGFEAHTPKARGCWEVQTAEPFSYRVQSVPGIQRKPCSPNTCVIV